VKVGGFGSFGGGGLAGPASAMVPVSPVGGGGGGGSGSLGGGLPFLGLSGVSIKAPGTERSLEGACEGAWDAVWLPNIPTRLGARHLLAEGRVGVRSVSETSCAAALAAAALSSRRRSSLWVICSAVRSSSESVSRSPGRRCVGLGSVSAWAGVGPGVGS
jgi:hypothetical protein